MHLRFFCVARLPLYNKPMTEWIEVSIVVDGEGAEAVADVLRRYAYGGVAIEYASKDEPWSEEGLPSDSLILRAYIPKGDTASEKQQKIEEGMYYLSRLYPAIPEPSFRVIAEEDWAEAWKQHYTPIRVGKRLLIKPAWIEVNAKPGEIVIEMDPGMAFGTGTHPTTQLCLQACEWFCKPGTCMVDLGTGSGILAVAAAKLGCYRVLALDIDEVAVRAARENAVRNGVGGKVIALHGSLDSLTSTSRHFDIAMANITAKVIVDMAAQGLQYIIWPGGKFIFSGIIEEQAQEVIAALAAAELDLLDQRQIGDWVMLITQRRYE